jgi:hypothetical protein
MKKQQLFVGIGGRLPPRARWFSEALTQVREDLDPVITDESLSAAPFDQINLFINVGSTLDLRPRETGLEGKCISISVAVPLDAIRRVSRADLVSILKLIALEGLHGLFRKYGIATEPILEIKRALEVEQAGKFPDLHKNPSPHRDAGRHVATDAYEINARSVQQGAPPTSLVVQYQVEGFGTLEDLARRHAVERIVHNCLQRENLGYCCGGDTGNNNMNIFCETKDPHRAAVQIVEELRATGDLYGAVLAQATDSGYTVVYPGDGLFH